MRPAIASTSQRENVMPITANCFWFWQAVAAISRHKNWGCALNHCRSPSRPPVGDLLPVVAHHQMALCLLCGDTVIVHALHSVELWH
jgi:hypothetical protein